MNDLMKYREYSAIIKFDSECNLFRAEVVDINDLITFHGDSVQALDRTMRLASSLLVTVWATSSG